MKVLRHCVIVPMRSVWNCLRCPLTHVLCRLLLNTVTSNVSVSVAKSFYFLPRLLEMRAAPREKWKRKTKWFGRKPLVHPYIRSRFCQVLQRPDTSAFGYPVERDLFRVGNARNEGITPENRRVKGEEVCIFHPFKLTCSRPAQPSEDYGNLICQGPSGDVTPRSSKLNEGDEEVCA
jgi:hypothetical protein